MTKERGGGREREGESIFKTKDRLGDNEWCKPDDLLVSAVRPHTHTWPPFLLLSLPLSTSLSLSQSGPTDLFKLRKDSSLRAQSVLHLIMEWKVQVTQRQWNNTVFICRVKCRLQQGRALSLTASA